MDNFTYDGKSENLQIVLNLHSHGGKALCYKCNAELLVLPDWASANKHGKRPGIYSDFSRYVEKTILRVFQALIFPLVIFINL